uniref:Transposase n=1 Tax=Globodera rostochiensis TaxID=31243 RepID=A0A914H9K7_GLORO
MEKYSILIFLSFFATNSLDKAESVKLELKTFDEIFGEGWWDKDEAEDLKTPAPTNFGQNVHHQIDRQNTQIGQIEPNSTDQLGQIEPNSTDQNPPLTASDHSDNAKNGEEQNKVSSTENIAENDQKQKFDQMKAELKRAGFKNSYSNQINETVAKELGISFVTIYNWKRELGQTKPKKYSHSEQKELMKRYYEIKGQNLKINDGDIAKIFKIGSRTLVNWKRQFIRQQFHPNSVNGYSVEENATANVQEIENSNSELKFGEYLNE